MATEEYIIPKSYEERLADFVNNNHPKDKNQCNGCRGKNSKIHCGLYDDGLVYCCNNLGIRVGLNDHGEIGYLK